MAVPARKTSKMKKRMRRGHIKLSVPNIHFDSVIGEYRLSHHVSPKGFYKGKKVVDEKNKVNADSNSNSTDSTTTESSSKND